MTTYDKAVRVLATAALLAAGLVGTSQAATISVTPSAQTIAPGGAASVDIVLSGLAANETVGGFSLLLSFNSTILGGTSFANDPGLFMGLPANTLDLSCGFSGGIVVDPVCGLIGGSGSPLDLFYLADVGLIAGSQGSGFTLATVSFTGLLEGLSALTLSFQPANGAFLSALDGVTIIPANAVNGSICVDDPNTPGDRCSAAAVSEPATLALGLLGGFAAFMSRRRRQLRS